LGHSFTFAARCVIVYTVVLQLLDFNFVIKA
jgi:hypothetical protein